MAPSSNSVSDCLVAACFVAVIVWIFAAAVDYVFLGGAGRVLEAWRVLPPGFTEAQFSLRAALAIGLAFPLSACSGWLLYRSGRRSSDMADGQT